LISVAAYLIGDIFFMTEPFLVLDILSWASNVISLGVMSDLKIMSFAFILLILRPPVEAIVSRP